MRIDLHTHTLLSDGELLPMELARRAFGQGAQGLAFTDHVALSTLERVMNEARWTWSWPRTGAWRCWSGVEITHVPATKIDMVVSEARKLGAEIVVIHGETICEPVEKGTNRAAVSNPDVDILAHPGFITVEEAETGQDATAWSWRSPPGHRTARPTATWPGWPSKVGAKMVVNTDAHAPSDLIDNGTALSASPAAAGLTKEEAERRSWSDPEEIIRRGGA